MIEQNNRILDRFLHAAASMHTVEKAAMIAEMTTTIVFLMVNKRILAVLSIKIFTFASKSST